MSKYHLVGVIYYLTDVHPLPWKKLATTDELNPVIACLENHHDQDRKIFYMGYHMRAVGIRSFNLFRKWKMHCK